MKYKIEDINIGDEIYFDDVYSGKYLTQSNYDEYWTVHGKKENQLLVNLRNVITSYSIHYTKLYDLELVAGNAPLFQQCWQELPDTCAQRVIGGHGLV